MTVPAPAPRRLDADARRSQILDAAQGLFIERGFEGVGMNDVARALGTSRPTVYAYFTSTADMLSALLDVRLPGLWQRLGPLLQTPRLLEAADYGVVFTELLAERDLLLLLHSGGGPVFRGQRALFLERLSSLIAPARPGDPEPQAHTLQIVTLLLEAVALDALRRPGSDPQALGHRLGEFIARGLGTLGE